MSLSVPTPSVSEKSSMPTKNNNKSRTLNTRGTQQEFEDKNTSKSRPTLNSRVTQQEFNDFCEGEDDPMLKFLTEELRETQTGATQTPATAKSKLEVQYQNTFRTEPSYQFLPDRVAQIINKVLTEKLNGVVYDPKKCSQLGCEASGLIKDLVKAQMRFPRHKLVSFVVIGEEGEHGAMVGSRCVWNAKFDGFASSTYKNDTIFAVGVLYAVYLE